MTGSSRRRNGEGWWWLRPMRWRDFLWTGWLWSPKMHKRERRQKQWPSLQPWQRQQGLQGSGLPALVAGSGKGKFTFAADAPQRQRAQRGLLHSSGPGLGRGRALAPRSRIGRSPDLTSERDLSHSPRLDPRTRLIGSPDLNPAEDLVAVPDLTPEPD